MRVRRAFAPHSQRASQTLSAHSGDAHMFAGIKLYFTLFYLIFFFASDIGNGDSAEMTNKTRNEKKETCFAHCNTVLPVFVSYCDRTHRSLNSEFLKSSSFVAFPTKILFRQAGSLPGW